MHTDLSNYLCGRTSLPVLPSAIDIDLTNVCNQDCFYCNTAEFRAKFLDTPPKEKFIDLIDKLADWRNHTPLSVGTVRSICFTGGGEPTVHPQYHEIIEYAIDKGFVVTLITNGSKLDKLVKHLPKEKISKILWVGVDIDSGLPESYEDIRKSLTTYAMLPRVKDNIRLAVAAGFNIDIKALLMPQNTTDIELEALFDFVKDTGARQLHIRPLFDLETQKVFDVTDEIKQKIQSISSVTGIKYRLPEYRIEPRTYTKCHQMFMYTIFSANGDITVCCEAKGASKFSIGNWLSTDPRDLWMGKRHMEVYNTTNTMQCAPCKPNKINNIIQKDLDDPSLLERQIM
jgi:molybdenum cofactor biosynthesis enzyme MoaA